MNKLPLFATAAALTLALGACASSGDNMAKETAAADTEQCFGVAKAGANDCKSGSHDCAGHATVAGDPNSFILVPAGTCEKIAGGKLA